MLRTARHPWIRHGDTRNKLNDIKTINMRYGQIWMDID
jgi:hypothetical protein